MQMEVVGRHSSYLLGFSKDFKIFKRLYWGLMATLTMVVILPFKLMHKAQNEGLSSIWCTSHHPQDM